MPIRRRRTTKARKTPIPLCTGCGYATIFPTTRLFNNFKAPKLMNPSMPPGEVMPRDASVISEWLPKARCDLAEYTREVDRLRSRLVKLEGVRDSLQQRIDHHTALVAPVARLPTEVLHMIFCLSCIPDESEGSHHRKHNASLMYPAGRTALRLALVCSRWRRVALCIPEMWSYINVSISKHRELAPFLALVDEHARYRRDELLDYENVNPIQDIVDLYCERSQNHPLAIRLYCRSKTFPTPERVADLKLTECICNHILSEVFMILCDESYRWRTAHVNLVHGPGPLTQGVTHERSHDLQDSDEDDDSYETLNVPLLEVLDIYPGPVEIRFAETPRLHTLRLTATPWGQSLFDKAIFKAPCLRSLTLRKYQTCDLTWILPALAVDSRVDVFFETPSGKECDHRVRSAFRAPAVKSITVDGGWWTSFWDILNQFSFPNATKMQLNGGASLFPQRALIGMLKRSAMPLTVLKFKGFCMGNDALVEILKLLPTIEVLEVVEASFPDLRREIKNMRSKGIEVKGPNSEEYQWSFYVSKYRAEHINTSFICSKLIRDLTLSSYPNGSHADTTPLLPNLTSLKLTFRPTCDAQDLKEMVYFRRLAAAPDTVQSQESDSEAVVLYSNTDLTRSAGGVAPLKSIKLVLIMDLVRLENRAKTVYDEFDAVIQELKDMGIDAQMKAKKYY